MGRIRWILPLVLLLFAGCKAVESIVTMPEQTEQVANLLEKELGTKPLFNWKINNGILEHIDVVFERRALRKVSTEELSVKVEKALAKHLKLKPRRVVVSIVLVG